MNFKKYSTDSLKVLSFLLFAFYLLSCRPSPQYQDSFAIPNAAWEAGFQPKFEFQIDDTSSAYQLLLLVRHSDAYPFSNIWITMATQAPGDTGWGKVRIEIPLAAPSGQWLGRGMGAVYEQRVPITTLDRPAFFPKKGKYIVRLSHDMRRNPLPEVMTVGLRIEKLPPIQKRQ